MNNILHYYVIIIIVTIIQYLYIVNNEIRIILLHIMCNLFCVHSRNKKIPSINKFFFRMAH